MRVCTYWMLSLTLDYVFNALHLPLIHFMVYYIVLYLMILSIICKMLHYMCLLISVFFNLYLLYVLTLLFVYIRFFIGLLCFDIVISLLVILNKALIFRCLSLLSHCWSKCVNKSLFYMYYCVVLCVSFDVLHNVMCSFLFFLKISYLFIWVCDIYCLSKTVLVKICVFWFVMVVMCFCFGFFSDVCLHLCSSFVYALYLLVIYMSSTSSFICHCCAYGICLA